MNSTLANALTSLPTATAPQPQGQWTHDEAQLQKYGGAYLTDLAERCDALIEEQTALLGYQLSPGTDVFDLDAGHDGKTKPKLAQMRAFTKKQNTLAEEIAYVDRLEDLPEKYILAFKIRQGARAYHERNKPNA